MKNKIIVSFLAALLWACSDGSALKMPEPPAPPAPTVTAEAVVPGVLGDQNIAVLDTSAGIESASLAVVSGSGVEIRWKIKGVVSAELTSSPDVVGGVVPLEVIKETKEAVGSRFIPGLTEDVTFTITAVNQEGKDKDVKKTEVKVTIQVTVTPAPVETAINKFEADPPAVKAGESAKLCWDVSPADAVITVVDGMGNSLQPEAEADVEAEDGGGETAAVASFKAVDCVTVYPLEETSYTLTATTADGSSRKESTVTVKMAEVEFKIVSFKGNGQDGAVVLDEPSEVRLTWEVVPESALVSISPAIAEVMTELSAKGSATVRVDKTTTYTLTASLGDKVESRQLTVNVSERGIVTQMSALLSASSADIFAGEDVTLSWSITTPDGSPLPTDAVVTLNGENVTGNSLTMRPAASGSYTLEVSAAGNVVRSNQVGIAVRSWKANESGSKWSAVGVVNNQLAIAGSASNSPTAVKFGRVSQANFERVVYSTFGADYGENYFKDYPKFDGYGPMPINAIVPAGGRIYAAATGALLYSDNSGVSWSMADIFPVVFYNKDYADYFAEYDSCKGSRQAGDKTGIKTLGNLQQLCDVLVQGERVVIATDHGVYHADNIDTAIIGVSAADRPCWTGVGNSCSKANELTGTVVNDLEFFGGIYAGTAKGVWISTDNAATWSEFNGGALDASKAVYALAIDASNKKIFAAGPSGVYSADLAAGGASWVELGSPANGGTVYSLAIDPAASGTVYAGTEKGVFISRDFGKRWVDISESMGSSPAVYSLAVSKSSAEVSVFAATSGGAFSAVGQHAAVPKVKAEPAVDSNTIKAAPATATEALKSIF